MSKVLLDLIKKHPDKLKDLSSEGADGYWLYTQPGWQSDQETHQIHEYTVKECLQQFRWLRKCPEWCDCK